MFRFISLISTGETQSTVNLLLDNVKGHPTTDHKGPREGVDVELYSFFNLRAR